MPVRGVLDRLRDPSAVAALTGVVVALVQLGPTLGHGYVLVRDLVFVPHPPLTAGLLGVDGVPRAVPSDLIVSLLSHVLPGDVVEQLVLLGIIAVGAWGAGRLVRGSLPATVAAAAAYGWNPYLTEHLLLGQWAILLGYTAAPWAVAAALDLRSGESGAGRRLFLWLAVAAAGGVSAELLAALAVVPVVAWPGGPRRLRRTALTLLGLAVLALPWAIPALGQPVSPPADRVGTTLFAAHPDTPLGTVGSLLTLGGVWNRQAVPAGRGDPLVAVVALAMTAVALWGLYRLRGRLGGAAVAGMGAAAALGLLLALSGTIPGARVLLTDLAAHWQPADLLRDGQRSLAPFVLAVSVGWGQAVGELTALRRRAAVLAAVPALLLPAAAWGVEGALAGVQWPADWPVVAAATARLPPGPVLVLPWGAVRAFPWNGDRPLDDPADRWLPRRVIGDTRLRVGEGATAQEDPLARRISPAVTGRGALGPALAVQGYGGVLVERDVPGAAAAVSRLGGLPIAARTSGLLLLRVPGPSHVRIPAASTPIALVGDGLTAFAVVAVVTVSAFRRRNRPLFT